MSFSGIRRSFKCGKKRGEAEQKDMLLFAMAGETEASSAGVQLAEG